MTTALRVGLVGTGLWAREVHAAALLAHPDVEFVGVWGRDRDRARAIADPARITAFDTVAALLEAVEAVTIAIPPAAQAPIALEAARAGKHVMMEKPIAMTAALADELEAAVRQRGVGSVVCFTGRWIPQFEQWLTMQLPLVRQDVALKHMMVAGFNIDKKIVAHRTAEKMAGWRVGRFSSRQNAQLHLLVDYGVIARQGRGSTMPDQIAARISHMRNYHAIVAQSTCHDGCCHRNTISAGRRPGFVHLGIGGLDQTR